MAEPRAIIDVQLTDGPVRPGAIEPFPESCGAECVFLGRTRSERDETHGALRALRYEAHETLACRVLTELADEAIRRFDARAVRLHHAVGTVELGEASVLVQVACGHRAEAFEACRWLIDTLKRRAPIWKQAIWAGGAATWMPGQSVTLDHADASTKQHESRGART